MTYIIGAACADGWIVASDGAAQSVYGPRRTDVSKLYQREGVLLSISGVVSQSYLAERLDQCSPDPYELASVVAGAFESANAMVPAGSTVRRGVSLYAWMANRKVIHFKIVPDEAIKATPITRNDDEVFAYQLQGMVRDVESRTAFPARWIWVRMARIRDVPKAAAIEFALDMQRIAAKAVPDFVGGRVDVRHVTLSGEIVPVSAPCPCDSGRDFQSCHGGGGA